VAAVTAVRDLLWVVVDVLLPWGPWVTLIGVGAVVGIFAGLVHGLLEAEAAREARRHVAAAALDVRLGLVEPGVLPRRSLRLAAKSAVWMAWAVPAVAVGLPVVVLAMVELHGVFGVEAASPFTVVATLDVEAAGETLDASPSPELVVSQGPRRVLRYGGRPRAVVVRVGDETVSLSPRVEGGVDGVSRGWGEALEPGRGRVLPSTSTLLEAKVVPSVISRARQPGGWPWEVPFLVGAVLAGLGGAWVGRRCRELIVGPLAVEAQAER
jgi:hypothetical protein